MNKIAEKFITQLEKSGIKPDESELLKEMESMVESAYNEDTDSELDYYIKEPPTIGDIAWLYAKEYDTVQKMRIKQVIRRSDDIEAYDASPEDVLTDGESKYDADAGAEFITDNDSYLVWFDYM